MNSIDLTPLYRNAIGFDRLASMLDHELHRSDGNTYPPYDIEQFGEDQYAISLAVAGFEQGELDIEVEKGVLTVRGNKGSRDKQDDQDHQYLYRGIAYRSFERKFNLAEHVEVQGADLRNGLLTISLKREVPEAMKPKSIPINSTKEQASLEDKQTDKDKQKAA